MQKKRVRHSFPAPYANFALVDVLPRDYNAEKSDWTKIFSDCYTDFLLVDILKLHKVQKRTDVVTTLQDSK